MKPLEETNCSPDMKNVSFPFHSGHKILMAWSYTLFNGSLGKFQDSCPITVKSGVFRSANITPIRWIIGLACSSALNKLCARRVLRLTTEENSIHLVVSIRAQTKVTHFSHLICIELSSLQCIQENRKLQTQVICYRNEFSFRELMVPRSKGSKIIFYLNIITEGGPWPAPQVVESASSV